MPAIKGAILSKAVVFDTQPGIKDLWFLPLGGCGEIGMNLNLYGHAGQWLMVDCGVTFYNPLQPTAKAQVAPQRHAVRARGGLGRDHDNDR